MCAIIEIDLERKKTSNIYQNALKKFFVIFIIISFFYSFFFFLSKMDMMIQKMNHLQGTTAQLVLPNKKHPLPKL
jgi:membrane associated rhomboid family serine protease